MPWFLLGWLLTGVTVAVVILVLWMFNRRKVVTGDLGIVGEIGVAETEINPGGRVFIHGEWWNAFSQSRIPPGERVRVMGLEGFTLLVEAVNPSAPRQASIVDADFNGQEFGWDKGG